MSDHLKILKLRLEELQETTAKVHRAVNALSEDEPKVTETAPILVGVAGADLEKDDAIYVKDGKFYPANPRVRDEPKTCPYGRKECECTKRRPKVGEWILVQVASNNDGDMDIGINSGFPNSFTFVRRGYYKLQGVGK